MPESSQPARALALTAEHASLANRASHRAGEAGVRRLERELGTPLRKIATGVASGATQAPVTVDGAVVREALGRPKFFQEAAATPSSWRPRPCRAPRTPC